MIPAPTATEQHQRFVFEGRPPREIKRVRLNVCDCDRSVVLAAEFGFARLCEVVHVFDDSLDRNSGRGIQIEGRGLRTQLLQDATLCPASKRMIRIEVPPKI